MNPGFGAGLLGLAPSLEDPIGEPGVLFNQITEEIIDEIENLIYGGVDLYFPTVKIESLNVDLEPDSKTIVIYLKYTVINTNIEDEIQINLNNGGV